MTKRKIEIDGGELTVDHHKGKVVMETDFLSAYDDERGHYRDGREVSTFFNKGLPAKSKSVFRGKIENHETR